MDDACHMPSAGQSSVSPVLQVSDAMRATAKAAADIWQRLQPLMEQSLNAPLTHKDKETLKQLKQQFSHVLANMMQCLGEQNEEFIELLQSPGVSAVRRELMMRQIESLWMDLILPACAVGAQREQQARTIRQLLPEPAGQARGGL